MMRQMQQHNVYTEIPDGICIAETGRIPVSVRWLDINNGDEANPEYRSRLAAQEIKTDKRQHFVRSDTTAGGEQK